jgi:predicted permease
MTQAELVSGDYFSTLGVRAARGRLITRDDDRVPGGHPVVVISHGYWLRRFAGDVAIVGRTVTISQQPMTIIGVTAPGFHGMNLASSTQVFVPVTMDAQMMPTAVRLPNGGLRWLKVYARLKAGVTPERAQASLEPLHRSLREQDVADARFARATTAVRDRYLRENRLEVVAASGGYTPIRGQLQRPLLILMAIVCGVLLIACANVANLLLARGAARQREVALRLSLGATRGRIIRQLLVESSMLALAGAACGLLLATLAVRALIAFFTDAASVTTIEATPDLRILAFTAGSAVLTGLLFGLAPAIQSTRPALAPTLKDQAGRVPGGGQVRVRKALVVSQVALSLLLLIGAGLFIRSLNRLMSVDLGFEPQRLVTFGADPVLVGYRGARAKQFAMDVLTRVRATPGVEAAAFSRIGLLWGGAWGNSIAIEGRPHRDDEQVGSRLNAVSPGYFDALGIPRLMGRDFHDGDHRVPAPGETIAESDGGYRVAIVSASFAKRYISGNPIGRHIGFGSDPGTPTRIEIVGVVGDSVYTGLDEEREGQIYVPFLESADSSAAWYYVRAAEAPDSMLEAMRGALRPTPTCRRCNCGPWTRR